LGCGQVVVFGHHLVNQFEPDNSNRQGLERIGFDELAPYLSWEQIGWRHRCDDKGEDDECQIAAVAQPRDDGHDEPYEKHDTKVGQIVFNLAG